VTKEEKPQSQILALTREAREKGLAAGMRYANALSIVPGLRARAVSTESLAAARDRIVRTLSAFTPDIEPCPFDTDAFWASADGLTSLFGTETRWSREALRALGTAGFKAVIVIGFTRFGTYAAARWRLRSLVFASREEEKTLVEQSPVGILPLPLRTRSTLHKLEIHTIGQFITLPEAETMRRFGKEAGALRRAFLSDDPLPVQSLFIRENVPSRRHLDAPLVDLDQLMPHIDELLAVEVRRAEASRSVISGLTLNLRMENGALMTDLIRPAAPTRNAALLGRLILLRLSARQLSSGVEDIEIQCAGTPPSRKQEELFHAGGGAIGPGQDRDLQAGAKAFAAIRARFGADAVTCAELRSSWLPERSFTWVPAQCPVLPECGPAGRPAGRPAGTLLKHPVAVRRIFLTPRPLPKGTRNPWKGEDPFVVSGSWWGTESGDLPFHRDYLFHRTAIGMLWIYRDRLADVSFVQGVLD
jgi:protein ImuB